MNKSIPFILIVFLGVMVIPFPNNPIGSAAAENPTNSGVVAGDGGLTAGTITGTSTFRIRVDNDDSPVANRAWEVAPGASTTVYYRRVIGSGGPGGPDGTQDADRCALRVYYDNTATVHQTLRDATTCPGNGTAYTIWCTANGASGGTPIAGTLRLRLEIDDETVVNNVFAYRVDTDHASGGIMGGSNPTKGAIRCGMDVSSISVNAYPAAATFAYTGTESITCTITHTAAQAQQVRTATVALIDASSNIIATNSLTIGSGATSTASSFTVSDSFPASSINGGCQFDGFGNSVLTGVKWTHISSATAPATVVSDSLARRSMFYNVDARITATHLLQVNSNTFGTPPLGNDIGDTRTLPDIGYIATRFTNARAEGLTGAITYTRTLQDNGAVLAADTVNCVSACIGTQGGQTGWSNLYIWNAGGPIGQWNKVVDITGPANIDNNAHLLVSTQTLFLELPDGGEVIYEITEEMGDPLKVFAAYHEPTGEIKLTISESYLNGNARTGNAAGTTIYVYDPSDNLEINGANPTEIQYGSYRYAFTPDEPGNWLILIRTLNETGVPVGTSNIIEVDSMTNEYLDAALVFAPLILLAALIIWAEMTREFFIYLLAIVAGGIIVLFGEWTDYLLYLRIVVVAVLVLVALRAAMALNEIRNQEIV
jgi:hypothetical protein